MAGVPEVFQRAVRALESLTSRPEVRLETVKPPKRLAPFAYALSADVLDDEGEIDLATGRLVLLHDPEAPSAWGGVLRIVIYLTAELDAEVAEDPLLPEVGWSWLTEALETSGADWSALGGTVTLTASARFGDISGPQRTHDLEMRASWTATDAELTAHGEAFCQLLADAAGLPPVGVSIIGQRQAP
ncbi:DUF3000 domain-containing protein [Pseudonocardiaceae bacterium YIM PH 21723]|nr:DUF3000 domain-containing protein [Pseudonocardiaceae bacterium YIM PH 21723]